MSKPPWHAEAQAAIDNGWYAEMKGLLTAALAEREEHAQAAHDLSNQMKAERDAAQARVLWLESEGVDAAREAERAAVIAWIQGQAQGRLDCATYMRIAEAIEYGDHAEHIPPAGEEQS